MRTQDDGSQVGHTASERADDAWATINAHVANCNVRGVAFTVAFIGTIVGGLTVWTNLSNSIERIAERQMNVIDHNRQQDEVLHELNLRLRQVELWQYNVRSKGGNGSSSPDLRPSE